MHSALVAIFPVFALILTGWIVRRGMIFGTAAASELNRFVIYLALPALMFDIVAKANLADIWQPRFIASFGLGCLIIFTLTLAICRFRHRNLTDATIDALGSSYANTGYIGIPLALNVFGAAAAIPALIASLITVSGIFAVAIILVEISIAHDKRVSRLISKVGISLIKNPLFLAPLLGSLFPLTDTQLPPVAGRFLSLLAGAASPCALVGLGLFLAEKRITSQSEKGRAGVLIGLKLFGQPFITWILATQVFHLPASLSQSAVLFAALPAGTGPFMLAEFYRRSGGGVAYLILGSTLLSVITITLYLIYGL